MRRVPEDEVSALTVLHTIACMFSPRIEYVKTLPATYALDIGGMNGLCGDEAQLANKLRQHITKTGFLTNTALAQNFDTSDTMVQTAEVRDKREPAMFYCLIAVKLESHVSAF